MTRLASARPTLSLLFNVLSFADPADRNIACYGGLGGQVIIARRDTDVRAARSTFSMLAHTAMSSADSANLIKERSRTLGTAGYL